MTSRTRSLRKLGACALAALAVHVASAIAADLPLDAPAERFVPSLVREFPASYGLALERWKGADDVNAWIGARFEYDRRRAMALSETQRQAGGPIAIHSPDAFYKSPSGICVDLARFAVETLRAVDPAAKPRYLMIEFEPVTIDGNTLRRHWLVSYERDGQHWFFADSRRPGHVAGPYSGTDAFIADYARYRGRDIVTFRELDSYQRKQRTLAVKQSREERR